MTLGVILLCSAVGSLNAQDRNIAVNEVYPDDMRMLQTTTIDFSRRIINVKALPPGINGGVSAVGDGITDDSNAIIASMDWVMARLKNYWAGANSTNGYKIPWHEYWTIYFPDGTYKVSKSLVYSGTRVVDPIFKNDALREGTCRLMLVGQSRDATIIKLVNNAADFGVNAPSRPVVSFSRFDLTPETINNNMPSQNQFRNFTIDTGTGNPAAVGVDFYGANVARMDNIKIIGSGRVGVHIRMASAHGYYSNIIVQGKETGIVMEGDPESHATFEYVTLSGQTVGAIYQESISSTFRKVASTNTVTGVRLASDGAKKPHMTIVDSQFSGGLAGNTVFQIDSGFLFSRNVAVQGYGTSVKKGTSAVLSGAIAEYVSEPITKFNAARVNSGAVASLNLPIEDYPIVPWITDLSQWANVDTYPGSTTAQKVQNAMISGKKVIYFPGNEYTINATITIPSTVEQVVGLHSRIRGASTVFEVSAISASPHPLVLNSLNFDSGKIVHSAARNLLLEGTQSSDSVYDSNLTATGTKVFANNTHGFSRYPNTTNNISAWIRWNNNEKAADWQFTSDPGSTIVVLGFKSEKLYSVFQVLGGSKLEVLGGVLNRPYSAGGISPRVAIFNDNSQVSMTFATNGGEEVWNPLIRDTQGATTNTWQMNQFPNRGWGSQLVVPLYVSYTPTVTGLPAVPTALGAIAGNQQAILSWSASNGATSYKLYRSTTSNGQGSTPLVSNVTGTTYTDGGLTNGITYYYKVAAVNASGTSALSNEASALPQAAPVKLTPTAATASDSENANPASRAIDGNTGNRWSASVLSCPPSHWLQLDLGSVKNVNTVKTLFYNGLVYTYDISVSTDGTNFITVVPSRNTTVPYQFETDAFTNVSARYVRINISSKNGTGSGTKPGIHEAEVYN